MISQQGFARQYVTEGQLREDTLKEFGTAQLDCNHLTEAGREWSGARVLGGGDAVCGLGASGEAAPVRNRD